MAKLLQVDAYPCAWPADWPRTPSSKRRSSSYRASFVTSRDQLVSHVKKLGAREIVVSANIPLRRDGLPLASSSEPMDPAVAVYWIARDITRVVACDQWTKVRENMRAVGVAVAALWQLQRSGATQVTERAFLGLAALPVNAGRTKQHWRDVFEFGHDEDLTAADVRRRYSRLVAMRHPDRGGTTEQFLELQTAYAEAQKEPW